MVMTTDDGPIHLAICRSANLKNMYNLLNKTFLISSFLQNIVQKLTSVAYLTKAHTTSTHEQTHSYPSYLQKYLADVAKTKVGLKPVG